MQNVSLPDVIQFSLKSITKLENEPLSILRSLNIDIKFPSAVHSLIYSRSYILCIKFQTRIQFILPQGK